MPLTFIDMGLSDPSDADSKWLWLVTLHDCSTEAKLRARLEWSACKFPRTSPYYKMCKSEDACPAHASTAAVEQALEAEGFDYRAALIPAHLQRHAAPEPEGPAPEVTEVDALVDLLSDPKPEVNDTRVDQPPDPEPEVIDTLIDPPSDPEPEVPDTIIDPPSDPEPEVTDTIIDPLSDTEPEVTDTIIDPRSPDEHHEFSVGF